MHSRGKKIIICIRKDGAEKVLYAYLLTRYASEYDLPEIPTLVKKTIMLATYQVGKLLGKYAHFKDAPQPIKKGKV